MVAELLSVYNSNLFLSIILLPPRTEPVLSETEGFRMAITRLRVPYSVILSRFCEESLFWVRSYYKILHEACAEYFVKLSTGSVASGFGLNRLLSKPLFYC